MENKEQPQANGNTIVRKTLLIINCILLAIGNCGGPLMMRLYFIHGGKRVWLTALLETVGWPVIFIPILVSYFHRRSTNPTTKFFYMKPPLFMAAAVIGILTGFENYLFSFGVARLPVSTTALIVATNLAFTAGFAFLLVRQKFTPYTTNAIVLLTIGAGVLALHSSSDRPKNESNREYVLGFLMTLASSALFGFILPLVELTYKKAKQELSYILVLEIQMVMCLFSSSVCTIGMLVNNDFKVIPREAREFELEETRYYVIIVCSAIIWQCCFLGAIGVIFCASSLLSGIIIAVLLPVIEILGVIFYHEKFQAEKGVALALSLWGFFSYFYGEVKQSKKKNPNQDAEVLPASNTTENV